MKYIEGHVEHLLGRRVVDTDGRTVGRLEELRAEIVDGELVVTEFHIGAGALLERVARFVTQLPFFQYIPFSRRIYRVPWQEFDLTDPTKLRVRTRRADLENHHRADPAGRE